MQPVYHLLRGRGRNSLKFSPLFADVRRVQAAKNLLILAALAAAPMLRSQDPRAAMEESVAKQRESVEKQKTAIQAQMPRSEPKPGAASFFTVPWTQPLAPAATPQCDPISPEEIGPLVAEISNREGLTPDLLRAVIEKESSYLPCAVSPKGAQGLMQLMPATAAVFGVEDVFNPRENVEAGAKFLKQLLTRYDGSLPLALAAYNAGPARVDEAGTVPYIPETLDYVSRILGKLR